MKNIYAKGLIILALMISQQVFPQKENSKDYKSSEQQIELSEGYSFISSWIMAENLNIQNILQNNLINLEFVRNSQGFMLQKIGPNWVNNIGDWVNTEGYLTKMSSADNLIINGDVINPQTPINLSLGYQMIGYLPEQPLNTEVVFEDILENLEYVRNSDGLMFIKIGSTWVNSIGFMKPGEGYLVNMIADDVLVYKEWECGDPIFDERDGKSYNTVQISDQCWLKENLNVGSMIIGNGNQTDNGVIEKYCYDNDPANCDEYGGLYQWNEMMQYTTTQGVQGICPADWHIPTDDEWKILEGTVDSQYPVGDPIWNTFGWRGFDAGLNLKSTSGWVDNGNGTDLYGFTAIPGGYRIGGGIFLNTGFNANFWSSTLWGNIDAWHHGLHKNYNEVRRFSLPKENGYSIRCLKDENMPPEPPSFPNPEDGTENQSIEIDLSWTCTDPESDPLTYDIYFGTEATPPLVITGHIETNYDQGTMGTNTEYFWKIVAHDDHNNTIEGPVWSFITQTEAPQPCPGIQTVNYEGQVYNTVLIGDQCWLKENLNVGTMINGNEEMTNNGVIEKYCYNNDPANCDEYGGLYQWDEMMQYTITQGVQGICPAGWHIPSDDEWKILEGTVDSQYSVGHGVWNNTGERGYDAGLNLKSTSGWIGFGNGTDLFGYSAIPGGHHNYYGYFDLIDEYALFYTSSKYGSEPWYRSLSRFSDKVLRLNLHKGFGLSVRCLKD
jgi:uncharacterized protein (TIGR02145 family)